MDHTNLNERKARRKNVDLETIVFGKVPPQAKDLEENIIGSILCIPESFDLVADILNPDCFYLESHKIIYKSFLSLVSKNMPIDILTVTHELRSSEQLDLVGGPYALSKLTNGVVSSSNIEVYARIVYQQFILREMIRISGEVIGMAYEDGTDAFDLLDFAEKSLLKVGVGVGDGMIKIDSVLINAIKKIDDWRQIDSHITGIPSGFEELDRATRGWQPGDLIILGARTSTGKTAFALNLIRNAAETGTTIGMWSMEMKAVYLVLRMMAAESKTFLYRLQTGRLSDEEFKSITKIAIAKLAKLNIFFDENTNVTFQSIARKARRLKKKNDLGMIVVDYLQLMKGDGAKTNREQELAKISRDLKNLAQELEVPVIALVQLNRTEGNKVTWKYGPPISSIRECGAIEQDADVIMMGWGPSDEDISKDPTISGLRKIRVAKQRNGVLLTIELDFKSEIQLFSQIENVSKIINGTTFQKDEKFNADDEVPF